jgi:hypothetical protein
MVRGVEPMMVAVVAVIAQSAEERRINRRSRTAIREVADAGML